MGISNTSYNKLFRYPKFISFLVSLSSSHKTLNPYSLPTTIDPKPLFQSYQRHTNYSLHTSSNGLLPNFSVTPPYSQSLYSFPIYRLNTSSYRYPIYCIGLLRPASLFQWFSVLSSDGSLCSNSGETDKNSGFENVRIDCFDEPEFKDKAIEGFESILTPKQVSEIIAVIRRGESDMASKLNLMGLSLYVKSINEIFRVLNCEKISALHFFEWVLSTNPELYCNYDVCSLIIDNCGWLDDYETMISMLKEFRSRRICLTEKAFGFLPVLGSSKDSVMESIRRLVGALNEVGGSCQGSGICELIKMLCTLDSFEMAKFVIEITERKVSYYNILIRERCKRRHVEEAHGVLKEMRELGCDPQAKTYNYLLACLCKIGRISESHSLLEEMQENGTPPDSITFEIFIYYSCKVSKIDVANQFLNQMVSRGLEPRLTTHAAFVKGYFDTRRYEEAYNYVRGLGIGFVHSSNLIYSLLASLHQKKGDLFVAHSILMEMMEKGLKPNFAVYVRIMKRLSKIGRGHLAAKLKSRFSRLRQLDK